MVDRIVDRLANDKVFKDSSVNRFREFLEDFNKLNIADDQEMEALVGRCQSILEGIAKPQELRDNDLLRNHVARKMEEVKSLVDVMIAARPIRKIEFD